MTKKDTKAKRNDVFKALLHLSLVWFMIPVYGQGSIRLFQEDPQQERQWRALRSNRNVRIFNYDTLQYSILKQNRPSSFQLLIPTLEGDLEAELTENKVLHDDFVLSTDKHNNLAYTPGLHYSGRLKGQENSMVVISLFQNEVMALISRQGRSNQVIGRSPTLRRNSLVLFDEGQQEAPLFHCHSPELPNWGEGIRIVKGGLRQQAGCIKVYFELGYSVYQEKGSTQAATDYISAIYNAVITIYNRESISTSISAVKVWTSREPYGTTSSDALQDFGGNIGGSFNGDLAHFVRVSSGSLSGIAWLDMLCGNKPYAYSEITNSFNALPTYSWTVHVVAHEMGHNLGSPHTQSCTWPGGPLDNCVEPEGSCSPGPTPVNGGTIMSYCHLNSGVGVNFNNGFGPEPGDLIRTRVSSANCLGTCEGSGSGVTTSPDLVIENLTASPPSITATTERITISYATANTGSSEAGSSQSTTFLSTDASLSGNDVNIHNASLPAIQVNGRQQTSFTYNLPGNSKSGTYYFITCADQTAGVPEFSEGNNCRSTSIELKLKDAPSIYPDLVPALLSSMPQTVTTGQKLVLDGKVSNQGSSYANAHILEMVLSSDDRLSGNDLSLFKETLGDLNPAQSVNFKASLTIPSSLELDHYYLLICSDPSNNIQESSESNNCLSFALTIFSPRPDLLIKNTSINPNPVPSGVPFTVQFTTSNDGTVNSPVSRTALYLSKSNNIKDVNDVLLGQISLNQGLAAGAGRSDRFTVSNLIAPGNYFILICADNQEVIKETNEANNCTAISVSITTPMPDLVTDLVTVPDKFYIEDSHDVKIVVRNVGAANASATRGQLTLFSAELPPLLLKTFNIPALGPNESVTLLEKVAVRDLAWLGQKKLSACADHEGKVTESQEANNCREINLSLIEPLPDLQLGSSALFDEVLVTGTHLTLPFEVTNPGQRPAPVSFTGIYYSRKEMVIDSTSLALLPDSLPSVSPGDTLRVLKEVLIPEPLKPGTWYLTLCLDSRKEVKELSEQNNCQSFRLELRNPMADLAVDTFNASADSVFTSLPFPVKAIISNLGEIPAENFVVEVYLASGSAAGLAASFKLEELNPGTPWDTTLFLVLPDSLFGQKTDISIHLDPGGEIQEPNLENNLAAFSITPLRALPDLQALSLQTEDSILHSGYPAGVKVGFQNLGLLPTGIFQVRGSYLVPQGIETLADTIAAFSFLHGGLAAGETDSRTISFTPELALPGGTYTLILEIDPPGEITESREDNNRMMQSFSLDQSLPDLTPQDLSIAGELRRGESMHATLRIQNIGNWTMAAIRDTVYLSLDSLFSNDDLPVALASLPELAKNQAAQVDINLDIPDQARSGTQYLLLTVNRNSLLAEKNKSNNSIYKKINIPNRKADLNLRGLQLTKNTLAAGDTLYITDFMENIGETAAGNYRVLHSIKKSPQDQVPLVTFQAILYSGLEPAGSTRLASFAQIPEQLKPDTYYLISCLDADGVIDEIRKDNNCGQLLFTVQKKEQTTPMKNDRIFTTFKSFPNPVIHELQIQGTFIQSLSSIRLTIRNYAGGEVYRRNLPPGRDLREKIDLSQLPAGVYYFDLASEKGSWKQPFIKL